MRLPNHNLPRQRSGPPFRWLSKLARILIRRLLVAGLLAALLAGLIPPPLLPGLLPAIPIAQAAPGTITGTVFQDYNADGARNLTSTTALPAVDTGVANVTVTAYDDTNTACGSTTSAVDGTYSLVHTCATSEVRIEFTNLPAGYESSFHGVDSSGSVQFVADNATAADFGINRPQDYCQNNPLLATGCYEEGNNLISNSDVVFAFEYDDGNPPFPGTHQSVAQADDVGPTWGLAFKRSTRTLFMGAFMKRHMSFGPGGAGAIYKADISATGVGSNVAVFADLNALLGAGTAGVDPHPPPFPPTDLDRDDPGFDAAGRVALGDLDIADDESTLFVINLADRSLYQIDISAYPTPPTAAAISRFVVPTPANCPTASDVRPFGTKFYNGLVYVGLVCTAESTQNRADLRAYVYTFDPATDTFGATPVIEFPLDYPRDCAYSTNCDNVPPPSLNEADWRPWVSTFPAEVSAIPPAGFERGYPQPLLSDIEFAADGRMVLGLRDRWGDQMGNNKLSNPSSASPWAGVPAGDLLLACPNGVGGWVLENNAVCGSLGPTAGANNGHGPGNGEFFFGEQLPISGPPTHAETSLGGLTLLPGANEVAQTQYDVRLAYEGGVAWHDLTSGARSRQVQLYSPNTRSAKSNGLGDLELLCDAAPIEIGNRLWQDTDGDGIQDPGEPGFSGAFVELYDANGTLVAQTATDGNGYYYFSSSAAPDQIWLTAIQSLQPNIAYTIRINPSQPRLNSLVPTVLDYNNNVANGDLNDSDGDTTLNPGFVTIPLITGDAGSTDHTYDVGFTPVFSLGNRVWYDTNNSGTIDGGEVGVSGVSVSVFNDANADGQPDSAVPIASVTTDASGYYRFDDLFAGTYVVRINPASFQPGGALAGYQSSTPTEASPDSDGESNDNGLNPAVANDVVTNGLLSGPVTLGPDFVEPAAEADVPGAYGAGSTTGTEAIDLQANLTVDFGFFRLSMGNVVWYDIDNDGLYEPATESGIDGATVRLFASDGVTEIPVGPDGVLGTADDAPGGVVTSGGGMYNFSGLAPGDYIVKVTPPPGYTSSTGTNGSTSGPSEPAPDPDTNIDNDDNGANGAGADAGLIVSQLFTLTPGNVGTASNNTIDNNAGSTNNPTVEFGLFQPLRLGNLVWHDADNDGVRDASEAGIDGVALQLFRAGDNPLTATPVSNTVTSGGGFYLFDNLAPGAYFVYIPTPPATYPVSSTPTDTADNGQDNDDNGSQSAPSQPVTSPIVTLAVGSEPASATDGDDTNGDLTIDFGFFDPVAVGDYVWYDDDVDGAQDTTEAGVPGVQVILFDATTGLPYTGNDVNGNPVTPQTTDANGLYLFDDLPPGDYYVVFDLSTLPNSYIVTTQNAAGVLDSADSDGNPTTGQTPATGFLPSGSQDLTLDLGIYAPVSVGDTVWYDNDRDGIYEPAASEDGVSGVTVTLYNNATGLPVTQDVDGNPITPQVTDANGHYLFDNLPPGDYYVIFDLSTLPAGFVVSPQDQGGDDALDSDANPTTGQTAATGPLTGIQSDVTLDMGIYQPVTVGDYVWYDDDRDGIQDPTEAGVPGVTATLYNAATGQPVTVDAFGQPVTSQTTDGLGYYLFDGLSPGSYYVVFDLATLPTGYRVTTQNAGANDALDSDANPTTGQTGATPNLSGGAVNVTLDMGIWAPVSVGDYVWYDDDADGGQDAGEPGVPGVQVTLFDAATGLAVTQDADGNPITPQTTDANGLYLFDNLPPGDYYVVFNLSTLPAGTTPTQPNVGGDAADSDANVTTGQTAATGFLPGGSQDLTLDMGIVRPVTVGNYVWYDDDQDGVQDAGETGVQGVTVRIFNSDGTPALDTNGNPVAAQVTDANGLYLFTNLPPGAYYVEFDLSTLPASYVVTTPNAGGSDALDSDANLSTGRTAATGFLPGGSQDLTLDMGIYQLDSVRVGDFVWYDNDADGVQDGSEPGVPGITAILYDTTSGLPVTDGLGNPLTDVTDASGFYLFDNLPPGDYYVVFDLATLPNGYLVSPQNQGGNDALDSDGNPATGQTGSTGALSNGQQDLTLDLGIYQPASIGDYVWLDRDVDGVQEAGEPPVPGVTVQLFRGDGMPAVDINGNPVPATTTDAAGFYQFTNLPPGDYYVQFTPPAGYFITPQDQGGDDALDSDIDTVTGRTVVTTLVGGENDPTWDAGLYAEASLGNYVWNDLDGDGIQDAGEPGIAGVTVTLYDSQGNAVATTQTDANGFYGFSGLAPGDYSVGFTTPPGLVPAQPNQGADDALDSDAVNGRTAVTTLVAGENDPTWDAGFSIPAAIGGYVWDDGSIAEADGTRGTDEGGMAGVTVILLDAAGNEVARTTTDATGFFNFTNLSPGDYSLQFQTPTGTSITVAPPPGSDEASDNDADTNGATPITTLTPGENDLNWGAGTVSTPTALGEEDEPTQIRKVFLPVITR